MEELIYTINPKDLIEKIDSLEIFFIIVGIGVLFVSKLLFTNKESQNIKIFSILFLSFLILTSAVDYYTSSTHVSITEKALLGQRKTKVIKGVVTNYFYIKRQKRELFKINGIDFLIKSNDKVFFEKYPKLLKSKKLKIRIEYIEFPKNNTTVLRIWSRN